MTVKRICSVEGCKKWLDCRGLCRMHYVRKATNGSVDAHRPSLRDWSYKYTVDANGCWNWKGVLKNSGYGKHRHMWERTYGSIPKGMDLDHLCRNRACINPAHMEIVTRSENIHRGSLTRLCQNDIRNIRNLVSDGVTQVLVAKMYLMSPSGIRSIVAYHTWKDVA